MSDDKGRNELAVIEQTMRDRPAEYRRDEGMQERYRSLVDARESGGAAVPAKSGGREARKAEIETMMRRDRARYFASPDIQAEYLALVSGDTIAGEPAPAQRQMTAPAASSADTTQTLGVALEPEALSRARERVDAVVANLDPAIAAQLEASFTGLSDKTRAAVALELGPFSRYTCHCGRVLRLQSGQL